MLFEPGKMSAPRGSRALTWSEPLGSAAVYSGYCAVVPFAFALSSNQGLVGGCESRATLPQCPLPLPASPARREAGTGAARTSAPPSTALTSPLSRGNLEGLPPPAQRAMQGFRQEIAWQKLGFPAFLTAPCRKPGNSHWCWRLHALWGGWHSSELCWCQKNEGYSILPPSISSTSLHQPHR